MFMNNLNKMLIKKAFMNPTQMKLQNQLIQNSKRGFSSRVGGIGQSIALGAGGACIAGLSYLSYLGHK